MPINPNIALSARGIELQNPLDQYSKVMAIQNAQQQNALAQQQMQEYSRTREEEQGIRNRLAGGASLEDAETRNFLLSSKSGRDILQRQSELQKSETEEATRRAKLMADTENMYRNMSGQIGNKADATAFLLRMVNDPALKGSPIASIPIMQQVQRIPDDPQGLDNWIKQFALGTTKYVTENKPVTSVGPTGIVQTPGLGIGDARVVPGTSAAFQMTPAQIAANKIAQGQLAVSQGQLGVAQQRLAQDAQGATKPLTEAQSAKRRDVLGKEFKTAQNALQTTQDVIDSIAFVRAEPGLSRATGFTGTLLPSFPEGQAASAETRLKNLEGKVTALGKAQAASTGAIGSIANQEWKILADQIAAIDRTKGTGPLLSQLELVEAQARGAMERIQDAYQRQFGEDFERFPQFESLPSPKSTFKPKTPAAGGNLNAAEQAELDQLRKRFGK